jgi:hypothetical protein
MESTSLLAIASVVCFVVYFEIESSSYIESVTAKAFSVSI